MAEQGNSYWQTLVLQYADGLTVEITVDAPTAAQLGDPAQQDRVMAEIRKNINAAGNAAVTASISGTGEVTPPSKPTDSTQQKGKSIPSVTKPCSTTAGNAIPRAVNSTNVADYCTLPKPGNSASTEATNAPGQTLTHSIPQEDIEDDSEPSDVEEATSSSYTTWPRQAVLCLISLYEEFEGELENPKNRKKDIWAKITKQMNAKGYTFTQNKIESKWRSLIYSHKLIKDNVKKTGSKRKNFCHFEEIDAIVAKRHDINPPVIAGSGIPHQTRKFSTKATPSSTVTKPDEVISNSGSSDANMTDTSTDPNMSSDSLSAVRRRRRRSQDSAKRTDISQQTLAILQQMQEQRQKSDEEKERKRDERAKERNDLFRQYLDIIKK